MRATTIFLGLFILLATCHPLSAAEVTNLRTHFSRSELNIDYDLIGTNGEKESGVEVVLNIKGNRYTSHMLSLSGDAGRSITLGKNRRIIWQYLHDFPEGLDVTFKCIVNAVPNDRLLNESETPSEGFRATHYAVNKQTITETRTKLMWTRNANIPIKPMTHSTAEKRIKELNQNRYGGYNDWRMPTRKDFEGLMSFGKQAGWGTELAHFIADYLTTCGFTHVQPGNYWTSTPAEEGQDRFLVANSWNGGIRPLAGSNYYYLWPVRTVP